jgi:hypothetical protein
MRVGSSTDSNVAQMVSKQKSQQAEASNMQRQAATQVAGAAKEVTESKSQEAAEKVPDAESGRSLNVVA